MIHTSSLSGVIVCQAATYLSSGKDGHGEQQQSLDLDLHGGQRTLADCQRLRGKKKKKPWKGNSMKMEMLLQALQQ